MDAKLNANSATEVVSSVPVGGISTIAVPMYVEPLSGRTFKTPDQATKHGLKMQKKAAVERFAERKRVAWKEIASQESFMETLKAAVVWQLEEWEMLHERKKAYPLPPEWKQGSLVSWTLQRNGLLEAVAVFEVWMDSNMYKAAYVNIAREEVVGSDETRSTTHEFGEWSLRSGGESLDETGTRWLRKYRLTAVLPLKNYPQLREKLIADIQLVDEERKRRENLKYKTQNAVYADPKLVELQKQLETAEEVVRKLEYAVEGRTREVEAEVQSAADVVAAGQKWKEAVGNATLSDLELTRLVELDKYGPYSYEAYSSLLYDK